MYKVEAKTNTGFIVKATTEDFLYEMDKDKKLGTTPVGYVVVALSGCALMCVRGYYLRKGIKDIEIKSNLEYDGSFKFDIEIDKEIIEVEASEIKEYIKKYCTVSQMLNKEISYKIIGK